MTHNKCKRGNIINIPDSNSCKGASREGVCKQ